VWPPPVTYYRQNRLELIRCQFTAYLGFPRDRPARHFVAPNYALKCCDYIALVKVFAPNFCTEFVRLARSTANPLRTQQ